MSGKDVLYVFLYSLLKHLFTFYKHSLKNFLTFSHFIIYIASLSLKCNVNIILQTYFNKDLFKLVEKFITYGIEA